MNLIRKRRNEASKFLAIMMVIAVMMPVSVSAADREEQAVPGAVEAIASVDIDAPVAYGVELEGADDTSAGMVAGLEASEGAVFFADDGKMGVPAEGDENVSLNYTKIIRHEGWFTRSFTVQRGGETKIAYCIEPEEFPPEKGTQTGVKYDNRIMRKALYYSYGYPGFETVTKPYLAAQDLDADYSGEDGAYAFSHLVLSYFYDGESASSDAFNGISTQTKTVVKEMAYALKNEWPDVPEDASLTLNHTDVSAQWNAEKGYQETPVFELKGHKSNKVTVTVPAGVDMITLSDNELTEYLAVADEVQSVDVYGGDEFFFTADETMKGVYESGELVGSLREFQPYLIQVSEKQDIMYSGDGGRDSVAFSVEWLDIEAPAPEEISEIPPAPENSEPQAEETEVQETPDVIPEEISDASPETGDGNWMFCGLAAVFFSLAVMTVCVWRKAL